MTISLPALVLLIVIAAVCGAIGKAIAGSVRGGLIVSTALGFLGEPRGGRSARRWRSPGSGGANRLGFSAAATSGIPASRRHVGGYLLARLAGTTAGKSHTVSSRPLAW